MLVVSRDWDGWLRLSSSHRSSRFLGPTLRSYSPVLPLRGGGSVQQAGSLHPGAHRVHPADGLFLHTAPAPLDALLDPKHERWMSFLTTLRSSVAPRSLRKEEKKILNIKEPSKSLRGRKCKNKEEKAGRRAVNIQKRKKKNQF